MKAEELRIEEIRIGNYLQLGKSEAMALRIEFDRKVKGVINGTHIKYFSGIPLTEEWLKRFGFVKEDRHYSKVMYDDKYMAVYYPKEEFKDEYEYEIQLYGDYSSQITVDVFYVRNIAAQYVHQLQNLYFALTGEELALSNQPGDEKREG